MRRMSFYIGRSFFNGPPLWNASDDGMRGGESKVTIRIENIIALCLQLVCGERVRRGRWKAVENVNGILIVLSTPRYTDVGGRAELFSLIYGFVKIVVGELRAEREIVVNFERRDVGESFNR